MPADYGGSAIFDGQREIELVDAQTRGMSGPVWKTGSAEDVGDPGEGALAHSAAGRFHFHGGRHQPVERTGHVAQHAGGDLFGIGGGFTLGVPQQSMDNADVDPVLEQVRSDARVDARKRASSASKLAASLTRLSGISQW